MNAHGYSARRLTSLLAAGALASGVVCGNTAISGAKGPMLLSSQAFSEGQAIPSKYTCDAENISPRLAWNGVPAGAKTLALIAEDPDAPAGTWVHWVVYDLPATATELPEGRPKSQYIPEGGTQGLNDFKHLGYGGPCPPRGKPHRYFFKLYALDGALGLKPGATKRDVERAMEGHALAQAQLMGTYQRK